MSQGGEVARWIDQLRAELDRSGLTAAELSRRLEEKPGFAAQILSGRRRLTLGATFRCLKELRLSPGTFCDRLYRLPGWHLELGERKNRPLLAELGDPIDGEPTWGELWQEALDSEASRITDVAAELEALRKLLEVRIRDRRQDEIRVQTQAKIRGQALERFLSAEEDLSVEDLLRALKALELPPASFFGDLFPVPGHERGTSDLTTPSWTEVLALADRLLASIPETAGLGGTAEQPGEPAPPDTPNGPPTR